MQERRRSVPVSLPVRWVAGVTVLVGIALRLYTRSDLWLDESLSVNIARLPVGDLFEALRHDGHPPFYYLLLHGWMAVFGEGDVAVRSLSGLFAVATLPLLWVAAKRFGGPPVAAAAVVLLATSPFAIRYATETRMYSLVMFLVVAGWLALRMLLDRPTVGRMAVLAVLSGLLALTHYWSFYLLAAICLLLLVTWRRGHPEALRGVIAIVAGAVLFLPWLPSFLEQAANTGTPWGRPERPTSVFFISWTDWGGGPNGEAQLLGFGLLALATLAVFGLAVDRNRIELDLRTRAGVRAEIVVLLLTMTLAVLAGYATDSAFASRYTAVVFPIVVLVAAMGILAFADVRVRAGVLAVLAVLGLIGGVRNLVDNRTQAADIAEYIATNGTPGDLVVFCPDQLGPSVTRKLPDGFRATVFPDFARADLVDWVDYAERSKSVKPADFAAAMDERGGDSTVWFVWSDSYRTHKRSCQQAAAELVKLRPGGRAVLASGPRFEHAWLYQYGPVPG